MHKTAREVRTRRAVLLQKKTIIEAECFLASRLLLRHSHRSLFQSTVLAGYQAKLCSKYFDKSTKMAVRRTYTGSFGARPRKFYSAPAFTFLLLPGFVHQAALSVPMESPTQACPTKNFGCLGQLNHLGRTPPFETPPLIA